MNIDEDINIQYFKHCDVEQVRTFYNLTSYRNGVSVKQQDEIVAAFERDKMIGVFRLCKENEVSVLRGFNVLQEYQGKGVGSLMLSKFDNELAERACYLICKKTLNKFYALARFKQAESKVPDFLLERMISYNNAELNILVRQAN